MSPPDPADVLDCYEVGGAVRDALLGLPVRDRDWVVVGATPQRMVELGFRPVGRDFPVFLHPSTHEEYALARTERKTAPGYRGFVVHCAPDVTLADDLRRRDLSINAMARARDGTLVDPWGGERDLRAGVLRHVGPAFTEDPVRILRLARFAARFGRFAVAPDTMTLMRAMVDSGEVDALVPERVWQEWACGLTEATPSRMLDVLRACGALARVAPELDALWGVPQAAEDHPEVDSGTHAALTVDAAAALGATLPARFAALVHDLGKADTPRAQWPRHVGHEARSVARVGALCDRLKAPNDCRELAVLAAREHGVVHRAAQLAPPAIVELFDRCDAWRKPARFDELLVACEADFRGRPGRALAPYPPGPRLRLALATARTVDAGAVAAAHAADPQRIREALAAARAAAVASALPDASDRPRG